MHVKDLSPEDVSRLVSDYFREVTPDTRKRLIPLLKNVIKANEDENVQTPKR